MSPLLSWAKPQGLCSRVTHAGEKTGGLRDLGSAQLCLNLELIGCFCCEGHRKWEAEKSLGQTFIPLWGWFPSITQGTEFQLYLTAP